MRGEEPAHHFYLLQTRIVSGIKMTSILRKTSYIIKREVALLLEPIIGYSRMVSLTKMVLLCFAVLLTIALIAFPLLSNVNKNFRLTFSSIEKNEGNDKPKMLNPHFQGLDKQNQTYNVTADYALQETKNSVSLSNINADITLKNDGWVTLSAREGFFDHSTSQFDLKGNITAFNNDGYEFTTPEVTADVKKGYAEGMKGIAGQGPGGNIAADRFYVYMEGSGNRLVFQGNVKLVIFNN